MSISFDKAALLTRLPKDPSFNRWEYYLTIGVTIIDAAAGRGIGAKQALYSIAQTRTESGFRMKPVGNNIFGITTSDPARAFRTTTEEVVDGQRVTQANRMFVQYGSLKDSVDGYFAYLEGTDPTFPRGHKSAYAALTGGKPVSTFADALDQSHYSTDPNYGSTIQDVHKDVVRDFKAILKQQIAIEHEEERPIQQQARDLQQQLGYMSGIEYLDETIAMGNKLRDLVGQLMKMDQDLVDLNKLRNSL